VTVLLFGRSKRGRNRSNKHTKARTSTATASRHRIPQRGILPSEHRTEHTQTTQSYQISPRAASYQKAHKAITPFHSTNKRTEKKFSVLSKTIIYLFRLFYGFDNGVGKSRYALYGRGDNDFRCFAVCRLLKGFKTLYGKDGIGGL